MRAYSYIRFSTPGQSLGDSLRRQVALAREWCDARGVELVEDYRDLGVSAFKGRNAAQGKLGAFLAAVESGEIAPGSVLIVESLDRITRSEISAAVTLFMRLINGGVTVVTLADGKEYKRATINDNMTDLMLSILIMSRANEESRTKSRRISAAWHARRESVKRGEVKPNRHAPSWLKLGDGDKWRLVPDRAKAVREMFRMAAEGFTLREIGDKLLQAGRKPIRGKFWQTRSVKIAIQSRAAIGELVLRDADGSRVSLANYFPAVVTVEQWKAANVALAQRSFKPGRKNPSNCLRGLMEDGEGNPCHVHTHTRTSGRRHSYIVTYFKKTGRSATTGWLPDALLHVIRATLETATQELARLVRPVDGSREVVAQELAGAESRLENLVQALENGYSAALEASARKWESKRDELRAKLDALEITEGAPGVAQRKIPNDPGKLAAHFRSVLSRVVLLDRGTVRVELRAGAYYVARMKPEGVTLDIPKE